MRMLILAASWNDIIEMVRWFAQPKTTIIAWFLRPRMVFQRFVVSHPRLSAKYISQWWWSHWRAAGVSPNPASHCNQITGYLCLTQTFSVFSLKPVAKYKYQHFHYSPNMYFYYFQDFINCWAILPRLFQIPLEWPPLCLRKLLSTTFTE